MKVPSTNEHTQICIHMDVRVAYIYMYIMCIYMSKSKVFSANIPSI